MNLVHIVRGLLSLIRHPCFCQSSRLTREWCWVINGLLNFLYVLLSFPPKEKLNLRKKSTSTGFPTYIRYSNISQKGKVCTARSRFQSENQVADNGGFIQHLLGICKAETTALKKIIVLHIFLSIYAARISINSVCQPSKVVGKPSVGYWRVY